VTLLNISSLLGGLAIFLYGMAQSRDSLQLVAGSRLRSAIATFTENRILGVTTGIVVTILLNSSSATTVMLVNFVSTGLMSLSQAMAVTLGASVGTTVTVQIISFKLSHYALLLVAIGFAVMYGSSRRRARYSGQLILSFGFIFYGMQLMGDATAPLKEAAAFRQMLSYLGEQPWAGFLGAAIFTGIVQASAATIGLLISLAIGGTMTIDVALPMVLGANVGTAVTALLAGLGSNPDGKRVAIAHMAYKAIAAGLCMTLLPWFRELTIWSSSDIIRQIANSHTIFNVSAALLFLPFTRIAAKAIEKYYHPEEEELAFAPKYLERRALETPVLAFGHVTREFMRMADIVNEMFKASRTAFEVGDPDQIAGIEAEDDKVDILNREIKLYLARLTQRDLTPDEADHEMELVGLANELENAGDIVNKNILALAKKFSHGGLSFSESGWEEIRDLHGKVAENFDLALVAFSTGNEELARKVVRHFENFERLESELRQAHMRRLHQAVPETFETSAIHMDLITYFVRVNAHVACIAKSVLRNRSRKDLLASEG